MAGKSGRLEAGTSRRSEKQGHGLALRNGIIISQNTGFCKSKFCPGRRWILLGWNLVFETIGVAWAVKWLMDLVDRLDDPKGW